MFELRERIEPVQLQALSQFAGEVSELDKVCEEISKNLLHPEFRLPNLCAPLPQQGMGQHKNGETDN